MGLKHTWLHKEHSPDVNGQNKRMKQPYSIDEK